jgi:hypothetical protein
MALVESKEERNFFTLFFEKNTFVELSLDPYGSFVIQKLFKMFEDQEILFYNIIYNLDMFINDQNGIRVLKQAMSNLSECFQIYLVNKITSNILHYTQSEPGSYVVQYILKVKYYPNL